MDESEVRMRLEQYLNDKTLCWVEFGDGERWLFLPLSVTIRVDAALGPVWLAFGFEGKEERYATCFLTAVKSVMPVAHGPEE